MYHSHMYIIYMNGYIYGYIASPVTIYMPTDLFSVRGKRKGVRQSRRAREVLEDPKEGRQQLYAHNEVICINIRVYMLSLSAQ